MISRCASLSIGLMAVCLMVASVFAAEAEDGAGGAAKNEARLLVGKHVRFLSLLYLLKLYILQGCHQDFNPTKAKIQNFSRS